MAEGDQQDTERVQRIDMLINTANSYFGIAHSSTILANASIGDEQASNNEMAVFGQTQAEKILVELQGMGVKLKRNPKDGHVSLDDGHQTVVAQATEPVKTKQNKTRNWGIGAMAAEPDKEKPEDSVEGGTRTPPPITPPRTEASFPDGGRAGGAGNDILLENMTPDELVERANRSLADNKSQLTAAAMAALQKKGIRTTSDESGIVQLAAEAPVPEAPAAAAPTAPVADAPTPATDAPKVKMQLADPKLRRIGDLMEEAGLIDGPTHKKIEDAYDATKGQNPRPRFGEVAEKNGVTKETVDRGLITQAAKMTDAATKDILSGEKRDATGVSSSWSNNSAKENPTRGDAASDVANMTRNLALMINDHPELRHDMKVIAAVNSAVTLQDALQKDGKITNAGDLAKDIGEGLKYVADKTGAKPVDLDGKPVDVDKYIEARTKEITEGAKQPLAKAQEADKGKTEGQGTGAATGADGAGRPADGKPADGKESAPDKGKPGFVTDKLEAAIQTHKGVHRYGGDGKEAVQQVQKLLHVEEDGKFGEATHKAVLAFQKAAKEKGIDIGAVRPDGDVGEKTLAALKEHQELIPGATPKPAGQATTAPTR